MALPRLCRSGRVLSLSDGRLNVQWLTVEFDTVLSHDELQFVGTFLVIAKS